MTTSNFARFGSGQAVRRIEDQALLTGAGRYTDDERLPGEAHLVFVRSPHAHATLGAIDAGAARAMPGVLAVVRLHISATEDPEPGDQRHEESGKRGARRGMI